MFKAIHLSIGYKSPLVSALNFSVNKGEILFVIGTNGSGKSTLLKNVSDNLKPLSGQIENSEPNSPLLISSQIEIQTGLTGHDIFDLFESKNSKWFDPKWIREFQLENLLEKPFEHLSAGEQQRILLTVGLFYKTDLVLFDEPLSFLDWNFYFVFQRALSDYNAKGRAFLIANHDLNFSLHFKNSKTIVLIPANHSFIDLTEKVLNDKRLETLFNIRTEVIDRGGTKTLLLNPYGN